MMLGAERMRQLLLEGQGVVAGRLVVDVGHLVPGDAVADHGEEADPLEGVAQLGGQSVGLAGDAGPQAGQIERRQRVGAHGPTIAT